MLPIPSENKPETSLNLLQCTGHLHTWVSPGSTFLKCWSWGLLLGKKALQKLPWVCENWVQPSIWLWSLSYCIIASVVSSGVATVSQGYYSMISVPRWLLFLWSNLFPSLSPSSFPSLSLLSLSLLTTLSLLFSLLSSLLWFLPSHLHPNLWYDFSDMEEWSVAFYFIPLLCIIDGLLKKGHKIGWSSELPFCDVCQGWIHCLDLSWHHDSLLSQKKEREGILLDCCVCSVLFLELLTSFLLLFCHWSLRTEPIYAHKQGCWDLYVTLCVCLMLLN